jgi:hypothetical protein
MVIDSTIDIVFLRWFFRNTGENFVIFSTLVRVWKSIGSLVENLKFSKSSYSSAQDVNLTPKRAKLYQGKKKIQT